MANHPDQSAVVAHAKADLEAAGVSLVGPCGAFAIVQLAAWRLRYTGVGLLDKRSGNNCDGYSTDTFVYPDGEHYDVLIAAGGEEDPLTHVPIPGTGNRPAWQPEGLIDPIRWRAPIDPHFDEVPVPPVPPVPLPPSPPSEDLSRRVEVLIARVEGLAIWTAELAHELAAHRAVAAHADRVEAVLAVQARGLTGRLFGYTITLRPPAQG